MSSRPKGGCQSVVDAMQAKPTALQSHLFIRPCCYVGRGPAPWGPLIPPSAAVDEERVAHKRVTPDICRRHPLGSSIHRREKQCAPQTET
jgi:hypothetical protein